MKGEFQKILLGFNLTAATKLGQGNVFTGGCLSTGGVLPQCMLGYHPPEAEPPPGPVGHPPGPGSPPRTRQTPTPGKQTPEYGLRAAGAHPTGMHSCLVKHFRFFFSNGRQF